MFVLLNNGEGVARGSFFIGMLLCQIFLSTFKWLNAGRGRCLVIVFLFVLWLYIPLFVALYSSFSKSLKFKVFIQSFNFGLCHFRW